jgi:chromosomal replication initiation ATPase DnaA
VIDDIVGAVASRCGVGAEEIRSSSHRPTVVTARALVAYIAIRRHGLTPTAVGRALGISRRSAMRAFVRAQQLGVIDAEL